MELKLAQELRKTGFPQKRVEYNCQYCESAFGPRKQDEIYVPTLEELIEACGEDFRALLYIGSRMDGDMKWRAHAHNLNVGGSAPEIAVANLWLALNATRSTAESNANQK